MSLLAYFMAHAPAEPPTWLKPSCPAFTPPPYPSPIEDLTEEEQEDLDKYNEGWFPGGGAIASKRVRKYAMAREARDKAIQSQNHEI